MELTTLQTIRKNNHLSRRELADKSGVSADTIAHLENGTTDIRQAKLQTLYDLAKALHCKVRDFFPNEKII
jgi:transcriptional regulator with XRE-family HTH domain